MSNSVLIVDDERGIRETLRAVLEDEGFEVEAFASAEELLAQGIATGEMCLVLDVDLPGMDGVELKRRLDAYCGDVPSVFITALTPGEIGTRYAALATATVLYKPFNRDDLLAAIEKVSAWDGNSSYH